MTPLLAIPLEAPTSDNDAKPSAGSPSSGTASRSKVSSSEYSWIGSSATSSSSFRMTTGTITFISCQGRHAFSGTGSRRSLSCTCTAKVFFAERMHLARSSPAARVQLTTRASPCWPGSSLGRSASTPPNGSPPSWTLSASRAMRKKDHPLSLWVESSLSSGGRGTVTSTSPSRLSATSWMIIRRHSVTSCSTSASCRNWYMIARAARGPNVRSPKPHRAKYESRSFGYNSWNSLTIALRLTSSVFRSRSPPCWLCTRPSQEMSPTAARASIHIGEPSPDFFIFLRTCFFMRTFIWYHAWPHVSFCQSVMSSEGWTGTRWPSNTARKTSSVICN
mmetsp:Transcript_86789/g.265675  ORF Transcript_86789/g.265675 Transcript_86789/m.265675 type:complete len:334 (+) Transcript_86789:46-1047(+)